MTHENLEIPPAPWTLHGDALAFLDRDESGRFGVRALVRYQASPVGAYNETVFAVATKRGVRVLEMPVTLQHSMIGGRALWGFPKTLEQIEYSMNADAMFGNRVAVRFRNQTVRARISRWSFPMKMRAWTIQTLNGQNVRVPISVRGRLHFSWRGRQLGAYLSDFELIVAPPEVVP